MRILVARYDAAPTLENALKIRAYDRKHPMASCTLSVAEAAMVDIAIAHANRGS